MSTSTGRASSPGQKPTAGALPVKKPQLRGGKPVESNGPLGPGTNTAPPTAAVGSEAQRAMIAEAAYYRAEQRGFAPGCEIDDWLQAEGDIERTLAPR